MVGLCFKLDFFTQGWGCKTCWEEKGRLDLGLYRRDGFEVPAASQSCQ